MDDGEAMARAAALARDARPRVTPRAWVGAVLVAADGTAYFVMNGRVLTTRGGTAAPLEMPGDAPAPAGPIVWMP